MVVQPGKIPAFEPSVFDFTDQRDPQPVKLFPVSFPLRKAERLAEPAEEISLPDASAKIARKNGIGAVFRRLQRNDLDAVFPVGLHDPLIFRLHFFPVQTGVDHLLQFR